MVPAAESGTQRTISVFSSEQGGLYAYHMPYCHRRRLPEMPDIQGLSGQFPDRRPTASQTGTVAVALRSEKNVKAHAEEALD